MQAKMKKQENQNNYLQELVQSKLNKDLNFSPNGPIVNKIKLKNNVESDTIYHSLTGRNISPPNFTNTDVKSMDSNGMSDVTKPKYLEPKYSSLFDVPPEEKSIKNKRMKKKRLVIEGQGHPK